MNRQALKTDLVVLAVLCIVAAIALYATAEPPDAAAHIIGVQHVYLQVTVWSDGTVDIPPPVELDARTARRLANRLEDEEDRQRPLRRATGQLPPRVQRALAAKAVEAGDADTTANGDADPTRCHAIAKSTGQRCKNRATAGHLYCNIHKPVASTN